MAERRTHTNLQPSTDEGPRDKRREFSRGSAGRLVEWVGGAPTPPPSVLRGPCPGFRFSRGSGLTKAKRLLAVVVRERRASRGRTPQHPGVDWKTLAGARQQTLGAPEQTLPTRSPHHPGRRRRGAACFPREFSRNSRRRTRFSAAFVWQGSTFRGSARENSTKLSRKRARALEQRALALRVARKAIFARTEGDRLSHRRDENRRTRACRRARRKCSRSHGGRLRALVFACGRRARRHARRVRAIEGSRSLRRERHRRSTVRRRNRHRRCEGRGAEAAGR